MFEISFSKCIKNFRKENNLSQEEFANMLQVSRTTIVSYEKGTTEPTLYVLFRAAKVMNCSLDELVGINSPENKVKVYNKIDDDNTLKLEEELNEKLKTLNNLIKRYRRSFEELTMSKKRTDRMLDELIMAKKRNDLIYEELKRAINRVAKSEDEFTEIINSLSLDTKNNVAIDSEDFKHYFNEDITYISVPSFSSVACGAPVELDYESPQYVDIPLLPPLSIDKVSSYFVVTASGESMNKICQDGEKIVLMFLDPACSNIKSGDILAISIDNCVTLKELILSDNKVTLKPHSTDPEFVETTYTCNEFKTLEIQGKFICTVNELYDKF